MKRKVYTELLKRKEKSDRKPLILRGVWQVGKTWIMKEFGQNEYRNYIYAAFCCQFYITHGPKSGESSTTPLW